MLAGLLVSDPTNCQSPEDLQRVSEHRGKGRRQEGARGRPCSGPMVNRIQRWAGLGSTLMIIRPFPGSWQDPAQFILARGEKAAITWFVNILLEMPHTKLRTALGPWKILQILRAPASR